LATSSGTKKQKFHGIQSYGDKKVRKELSMPAVEATCDGELHGDFDHQLFLPEYWQ
jgi:hypothetical protein